MELENNQKGRILSDLLEGKEINMLENLQRYGTSCRSRIAELRAEGYKIEDYIPKGQRYKIYYMPKDEIARHKKCS